MALELDPELRRPSEGTPHHQFVRIYQKSVGNVAGTNVPYEELFFIGYDKTSKHHLFLDEDDRRGWQGRYVLLSINVFGVGTPGDGQRSGNEIKFVENIPEGRFKGRRGQRRFASAKRSKRWTPTLPL